MIETLPTLTERRDQIVTKTDEWMQRTIYMVNKVMLPNYATVQESLTSKLITTGKGIHTTSSPFIVLPAEVLKTYDNSAQTTRNIAVRMFFNYSAKKHRRDEIIDGIKSASMPIPDEISFADPHPVANSYDIQRGLKLRSDDTLSISGARLKLNTNVVSNEVSGSLPYNFNHSKTPEWKLFDAFRSYSPDALALHPESVDFHQAQLDMFTTIVGKAAVALQMPDLNPRVD